LQVRETSVFIGAVIEGHMYDFPRAIAYAIRWMPVQEVAMIAKRAILTLLAIFALAFASRPCLAGDNTLSDEDIDKMLQWMNEYQNEQNSQNNQNNPQSGWSKGYLDPKTGWFWPGRDPKTGLPLQDAGAVDNSQQVIGGLLMGGTALLGAKALAGALIVGTAGDATAGATVLGSPPIYVTKALMFFNTTAGAANFTFDFSAGATAAQQTASALVVLQGAISTLNQVIASGEIPPNWIYNGSQMTMETAQFFLRNFQNMVEIVSGNGVGMTDPQTDTVASTNSLTDLNNTVAYSTADGGGAADSGDSD